MKTLLACAAFTLLAACAMPETIVRSGSSQPGLVVKGAPADSVLYVDGLLMGPAPQFNGNPNVLNVLEGVHTVEIRRGNSVYYSERAFVTGGETHTVTVVGGAAQ